MGSRGIITNAGMELLASSTSVSGQHYWLGYYSPCYVPNAWKEDSVDLDSVNCVDQQVNPTGSPDLGPIEKDSSSEKLSISMTSLTISGDMIWNVFQGDLVGPGFIDGLADGSPAGDLFGLVLYSANVKKHYRYVLDENGNNNLVSWKLDPIYTDPATGEPLMEGAYRYRGTDGFVTSAMPIPAPLYYFGDASKDNTLENPTFDITDYLADFALDTGFDRYPFIKAPIETSGPLDLSGYDTIDYINKKIKIPKISSDFRTYMDFSGVDTNSPSTNAIPGGYFEDNEIPAAHANINDVNGWFDAASTYIDTANNPYLDEFYKLLSVSNYNRYHAPVGSEGNILNSDLKNRNMAKVSKLFPIFDYSVINTQRGFTTNGETREVATGISLIIELNLAPLAKTQGFKNVDASSGVGEYDEKTDLTLQDRYNNPSGNTDSDAPLYNSTQTSFKFNRIGLYAVPVRKAPASDDPQTKGKDVRFEVEIDPDAEPVLFAVIDFDNTISLSDTGDGAHQFKGQFNINLESPVGVNDTPLLRDKSIFMNLYNDSSINWYRNQLLANASAQQAIIEIQQELANLRQKVNSVGSGTTGNTSVFDIPPVEVTNTTIIKNEFTFRSEGRYKTSANFSSTDVSPTDINANFNEFPPAGVSIPGKVSRLIFKPSTETTTQYIQFYGTEDGQPIFIYNTSATTDLQVIGPNQPTGEIPLISPNQASLFTWDELDQIWMYTHLISYS